MRMRLGRTRTQKTDASPTPATKPHSRDHRRPSERAHRRCERPSIEALIDAVHDQREDWRAECLEVRAAFETWSRSRAGSRCVAYALYEAALEREEQACTIYCDLLRELESRSQARARLAPL